MKKKWAVVLVIVFTLSSIAIITKSSECQNNLFAIRNEFSVTSINCFNVNSQQEVISLRDQLEQRQDDLKNLNQTITEKEDLLRAYKPSFTSKGFIITPKKDDNILQNIQIKSSYLKELDSNLEKQTSIDREVWNSYSKAFNDLDQESQQFFLANNPNAVQSSDFPEISLDTADNVRSTISQKKELYKDIQRLRLSEILGNVDIPILMYHRVRPYSTFPKRMRSKTLRDLTVEPGAFVQQLDIIKSKEYNTVTFVELQEAIDGYDVDFFKQKNIILTFDDSFNEHHDFVLPELQKRGMKGVFGIITGASEMSQEKVRNLHQQGMELIPHTHSHCALGSTFVADGRTNPDGGGYQPCQDNRFGFLAQPLQPIEQVMFELEESAKYIQAITGSFPTTMMYPYGSYNAQTIEILQKSDYRFAIKAWGGSTQSLNKPYELNRILIEGVDGDALPNWFSAL